MLDNDINAVPRLLAEIIPHLAKLRPADVIDGSQDYPRASVLLHPERLIFFTSLLPEWAEGTIGADGKWRHASSYWSITRRGVEAGTKESLEEIKAKRLGALAELLTEIENELATESETDGYDLAIAALSGDWLREDATGDPGRPGAARVYLDATWKPVWIPVHVGDPVAA